MILKNPRTPDTTEKNISRCAYMCGVWPVILTSHPAFTLLSQSLPSPQRQHTMRTRSRCLMWVRPSFRTYSYNLEVGEHYYSPIKDYLSTPINSRVSYPGALTYGERLHYKWLSGRKEQSGLVQTRLAINTYCLPLVQHIDRGHGIHSNLGKKCFQV